MYGRATNLAKKKSEGMDQDKIKELVKDALQNPKKADLNKDGKLSDYEEKRGAAIEKSMVKEWGSSDQSIMNQSIHRDLGEPKEFPGLSQIIYAAEDAVDFYWDDWDEYQTDRDGLIMHAAQLYANRMFPDFMAGMRKMMEPIDEKKFLDPEDFEGVLDNTKFADLSADDVNDVFKEDLDLGHEDNEPHMLKADLYRIGKYAMELYQMVDRFEEGSEEVDFPHWWQSKIIRAKDMLVGAKHYLDFEVKEPQIDAMVDVAAEEDVVEEPLKEGVWSLGSINDIKAAIQTMEMGLDMDDTELEKHLQDNDAYFYNVLGDDELHDPLSRAYDLAAMGNEDRAHNELSDAIGRAYDLLKMQMEKEQDLARPNTSPFGEIAEKLAQQLKSK